MVSRAKIPLLLGQLKAISAPFYTRLAAAYPTWLTWLTWLTTERTTNATNLPNSIFPWTTTPDDDQNKATATLGQLKAVFSLRFETLPALGPDTDGDGMPDVWEISQNLNPQSNDAAQDPDFDGYTNFQEYLNGTNPNTPNIMVDTDNDGMPDWWENLYGLNPNNSADANSYLVADGVTNLVKYKTGRNPMVFALADSTGTLALKVHTPLE